VNTSDREKKPLWKKLALVGAILAGVVGVGIQFIPIAGVGNNPPERFATGAPPEVEKILREACYDCHSNETRWPWYARLAPASWLMIRDVRKGRSRMNMSEWGDTDEEERSLDKENSWEQIEAGDMPPWFYIPMHPKAYLSDQEKALLKGWLLAKQEAKPEPAEQAGKEAAPGTVVEPAKEPAKAP
jgi:Haem-binding domain